MAQFIQKPIYVEAFRLGTDEMPTWFTEKLKYGIFVQSPFGEISHADIWTGQGWTRADAGDYVVRGINGQIRSLSAELFGEIYELAYAAGAAA